MLLLLVAVVLVIEYWVGVGSAVFLKRRSHDWEKVNFVSLWRCSCNDKKAQLKQLKNVSLCGVWMALCPTTAYMCGILRRGDKWKKWQKIATYTWEPMTVVAMMALLLLIILDPFFRLLWSKNDILSPSRSLFNSRCIIFRHGSGGDMIREKKGMCVQARITYRNNTLSAWYKMYSRYILWLYGYTL